MVQRVVNGGTDEVIAFMPIPQGGRLDNVSGEVHMIGANPLRIDRVNYWATRGYLLEVADLDLGAATAVDVVWDNLVPKDADIAQAVGAEGLDLDRDTADAAPFTEPGKPNLNVIAQVKDNVTRIFNREKMVSFAKAPFGFIDTANDTFWPTDIFGLAIPSRYRIRRNTFAMFGVAVPAMSETVVTVTDPSVSGDEDWYMLTYLEEIMDLAWPQMLGLTEVGAESPFGDVSTFLESLVEPQLIEETGGFYNDSGQSVIVVAQVTWNISVPGRHRYNRLSGG